MAETKNAEEATLPAKRKADDLSSQDLDSSSLKAPKIVAEEKLEPQEGNHTTHNNNLEYSANKNDSSVPELRNRGKELAIDAEEDEDGDYEEEGDDKSDDGVNVSDPVDRKGKGILIEEEDDSEDDDDDDDDDSSDGGDESDGESDLSDDPLAEVDLDNILPSRTRRRGGDGRSGVYIANDLGNDGGNNDNDNSDA